MLHFLIMSYKGIIFDKDGTLFDYYTVWSPVMRTSMSKILATMEKDDDKELEKELLFLIGIGEHDINPKGLIFIHNKAIALFNLFIFCKMNHLHYRKLVSALMTKYYDAKELLKDSLITHTDENRLLPLFTKLKEYGYIIGVVTSDNANSTKVCLDHFSITPFISMISTYDDHYKRKPNPNVFQVFCEKFSLAPEEVVVVGDASVDMRFAKRGKAGYKIAVLTGSKNEKSLNRLADVVYPTVLNLLEDKKLFTK